MTSLTLKVGAIDGSYTYVSRCCKMPKDVAVAVHPGTPRFLPSVQMFWEYLVSYLFGHCIRTVQFLNLLPNSRKLTGMKCSIGW